MVVLKKKASGDPSLSFRSDSGLWKCFGCKKAGDTFKFYEFKEGVSDFVSMT